MFENFKENNGSIINENWIEWEHFLIPNKPNWFREIMRLLFAFLGHCTICSSLDGCYFIEKKMPKLPQHERCDCEKKELSYSLVIKNSCAECAIEKFKDYIFGDTIISKGKNKIFESLGFTQKDSEKLKIEYETQALREYQKGNYTLKTLDEFGQRISIAITLNFSKFYTGWILEPDGKIRNTTPFGGWIN